MIDLKKLLVKFEPNMLLIKNFDLQSTASLCAMALSTRTSAALFLLRYPNMRSEVTRTICDMSQVTAMKYG